MESCWICFQVSGELIRSCQCPRVVHRKCLASWQLYSAGRREEVECRFCSCKLPDWKLALRPGCAVIAPVVAVVYEGQEYRFRVEPTKEGQSKFMKEVEALLGHPIDLHEVNFHCRGPTGCHVQLRGLESLDAAVYCAAATAADRAAQLEDLLMAAATGAHPVWGAAAGRLANRPTIAEGSGNQMQNRSSATSNQGAFITNVEAMQLRSWTARRAIDICRAGNGTTNNSSRDGDLGTQLTHEAPVIDPRVVGVSAAQRLPELAAAWAYLSSQATDTADATARIRLQLSTGATTAAPAATATTPAVAAVSADIVGPAALSTEQSLQPNHSDTAPQAYSAIEHGHDIPDDPSGSGTHAASATTPAPSAYFCVSTWVTALMGSVLECLAARTVEN